MSFTGVSFIGDGGRASRSASAINGGVVASGYHLLVVDGYSRTKQDCPNGEFIESRPFRLGGYNWTIEYFPNGCDPEDADSISLFLNLMDADCSFQKGVKVHFKFSFVDQVEMQDQLLPSVIATQGCDFGRGLSSWGVNGFIKREALEQSKHLNDDCFTVRCDMVFTKELSTQDAGAAPFVTGPRSDMREDFGRLLRTKDGADVEFVVGGETFTAHRCVLTARSRIIERGQRLEPMKDGKIASTIHIDDMEAKVFKALLTFIYTDSTGIDEEEDSEEEGERMEQDADNHGKDVEEKKLMWQHLLVAAGSYNIPSLSLICEEKLCAYIDASTAVNLLVIAVKHHCNGLKGACLDFLRSHSNLQKVMSAGGIDHLTTACPSILKELVAQFVL
jgi:speckle-type POZ protein